MILIVAAWIPTPAPAQSQQFVFEQGVSGYTGFDDTTIFSESENSGGGTSGVFSGTINQLAFDGKKQHRRTLIRIDLSSIPPGWIIESASLKMTVQMSGGNFGDIDYTVHKVANVWGEGNVVGPSGGGFGAPAQVGDATWLSSRHGMSVWLNPGGDFDAQPSAVATAGIAGSDVFWMGSGIIADLQLWVNIASLNRGWIIVSSLEGQQQRVKKFYSSEATQFRPVLTVVARPGPYPLGADNHVFLVVAALLIALLSLRVIKRAEL